MALNGIKSYQYHHCTGTKENLVLFGVFNVHSKLIIAQTFFKLPNSVDYFIQIYNFLIAAAQHQVQTRN